MIQKKNKIITGIILISGPIKNERKTNRIWFNPYPKQTGMIGNSQEIWV